MKTIRMFEKDGKVHIIVHVDDVTKGMFATGKIIPKEEYYAVHVQEQADA